MAIITIGKYLSNYKINRCGIMIYCMERGKLYFMLAKDSVTKELGDLGGGVKKYEKPLTAGLRELHEESRGIFSELYRTETDLYPFITLVMDNMAIIFVPIPPVWINSARQKFLDSSSYSSSKSSQEICDLVWICIEDFNDLIFSDIIVIPETSPSPIRRNIYPGINSNTTTGRYNILNLVQEDSSVFSIERRPFIQSRFPNIGYSKHTCSTGNKSRRHKLQCQVDSDGGDVMFDIYPSVSSTQTGEYVLWVRIKNFLRLSLKDQTKFYACLKNHALRINMLLKNSETCC